MICHTLRDFDTLDLILEWQNNPTMTKETNNFNARINRWDLIPIPLPLQARCLARMIPPNPIREIIIFITIIIFLIYILIAHTIPQPHPEAGQSSARNFHFPYIYPTNIRQIQKEPMHLKLNKKHQWPFVNFFYCFGTWKKR